MKKKQPFQWPLFVIAILLVLIIGSSAFFVLNPPKPKEFQNDVTTPIISPFPDVEINGEAFDAINYLNREDILLGSTDGNFYPDSFLNRAEFATIIVRLAGIEPDADSYKNCFPDVSNEGPDWFEPYVCFSKAQGWVSGYSDGEMAGMFGPDLYVMDIEVLTILSRLARWEVESNDLWYEPALSYALEHNIYKTDNPIREITRGKMANIIFRMLGSEFLGYDAYTENIADEIKTYPLEDLLKIDMEPYTSALQFF